MEKNITLDELLAKQQRSINQCTIEAVKKDDKLVKLTPWAKDQGCMCKYALKIPKSSIRNIVLTGETHYCCNKNLQVVEVEFVEDAKLTIQEILSTLIENMRDKHHRNMKSGDDFFFEV